ncbi:MAG: hypothetical protein IPN36_16985 [Bacteroidetes bacterium]|nr:hypothetical protein [Bacteroidota bacterium]
MVVCCDPVYPQCCDTDTVCVTILPVVSVGPITGTHLTACLPAIFGGSTYSVPAVSGATYQWTVPAGMSISSEQGTPIITTHVDKSCYEFWDKRTIMCVSNYTLRGPVDMHTY